MNFYVSRSTLLLLQNAAKNILDNHESHLSIPLIYYCRDNGVILLTLPPHCSHRLQSLDLSVWAF